ncbi:MAG: serine hydrolase [bacterium]|nr:serine hydrolase [bacterium]
MALFKKRQEEIDLKPENRRTRKEQPKPWGKKERIVVFSILLLTITASFVLDLSSRDYKLPGFPRLKLTKPSFDIFKEETIIIGNKQENSVVVGENIINEFKNKTNGLSGVYAFYVVDLGSNYSFGIDENEVMQAASLIKLPVMALVYEENLEEKYGGLVEAMGKRSDNTAFNTLVKYFGGEKIQNYILSLGMYKTSLAKNKTTAKDIGVFFQKLYQGEIVPRQARDEILDSLTDTIYEDRMAAGIPDGIQVSHKFGKEVHVTNEAGIIFADKPFVLVLLSGGVVEKEADEVFPELTRIVYRGMIK